MQKDLKQLYIHLNLQYIVNNSLTKYIHAHIDYYMIIYTATAVNHIYRTYRKPNIPRYPNSTI